MAANCQVLSWAHIDVEFAPLGPSWARFVQPRQSLNLDALALHKHCSMVHYSKGYGPKVEVTCMCTQYNPFPLHWFLLSNFYAKTKNK